MGEILSVQAWRTRPGIPWSAGFNLLGEILSVQARAVAAPVDLAVSFNLLGEILSVQARMTAPDARSSLWFQSLGRDSVCSSRSSPPVLRVGVPVSISWARFCLFKPNRELHPPLPQQSFNLLGEILSVQAESCIGTTESGLEFQSLGRDSVCSSSSTTMRILLTVAVSISWARFCLFKHDAMVIGFVEIPPFQSLGRDSVCSSCSWDRAQ